MLALTDTLSNRSISQTWPTWRRISGALLHKSSLTGTFPFSHEFTRYGRTEGAPAGHAIEHADADGYLGGLCANRARCQVPAREHLQAVHQCLGQRAPVISAALLPVPPAALANDIDRAVAPSGAGRSLRPGRRTITRRDRWCCPARRYRRVALVSVIRAIANVLVRHQRGTNLAGVRVHRQMHLAPGTTLRITVLAYLPFPLAKHLQADTVDHQMQRFAATQGRQHDVEIPGAAAQHRVVGHRQIGEGELVHTPCETLQRAQWQAKHLFESKASG